MEQNHNRSSSPLPPDPPPHRARPDGRRITVRSQGSELAVYQHGSPDAAVPSILLVHGYPDDHHVFDGVVERLAADRHVITYDTRNAGASRVTGNAADRGSLAPYRLELLVEDLYAVLNATGTGRVHLVGHDWGSIQGWAAIQDPRAQGRILSYTSISGPDLGHFRRWFSTRLRSPRLWPQALSQALRSWYVAAFHVPVLPDVAWKYLLTPRYEKYAGRKIGDSGVRGLQLYRANMFRSGGAVPDGGYPGPVQVVVPVRDPFLSPKLVSGLDSRFPRVEVREVAAGHWWPERSSEDFAAVLDRWMAEHSDRAG
ncbi:alpha/beta fold hydrolase [Arthrobacter sp. zg-Y1116]|uniref:alpha/beta fold hydrolase n=1 Tax=Arthrobacter sp. zg-Y1116 TaxID=2964611 RepID=UPI002104E23C|nr:alpha/beta fold hydrolase [Arthrobacter sp. zg-Y1116]MCQ1948242.1 alpha/beta fold hydrolase [Arthrobacter sp. zg-Y1116]